jgi:Glycosyl hydrolase catalytic core
MSTKKGFVYNLSDPEFDTKVKSVNPKWYYTWGLHGSTTLDLPFVPMAWGKGSLPDPDSHSDIILGFNEPDGSAQSNLTPQQALSMWNHVSNAADRIGSPATAGNPTGIGSWQEQFMNTNPKADFICVHWYAPPNASSFLRMIDSTWQKFNKPIWVTEFAVADWFGKSPGGYPVAQVEQFMKDACAGLDSRPYVERYTWKTRSTSDVHMGTSAIFNDDGSLTALGQIYASI